MEGKNELNNSIKKLLLCMNVSNPDLLANTIVLLLKKRIIVADDIMKTLGTSYTMALQIMARLELLNLVDSESVKIKNGKGRSKKIIKLNINRLKQMVRECIENLTKIEKDAETYTINKI